MVKRKYKTRLIESTPENRAILAIQEQHPFLKEKPIWELTEEETFLYNQYSILIEKSQQKVKEHSQSEEVSASHEKWNMLGAVVIDRAILDYLHPKSRPIHIRDAKEFLFNNEPSLRYWCEIIGYDYTSVTNTLEALTWERYMPIRNKHLRGIPFKATYPGEKVRKRI